MATDGSAMDRLFEEKKWMNERKVMNISSHQMSELFFSENV